jgi:hypothetical protein
MNQEELLAYVDGTTPVVVKGQVVHLLREDENVDDQVVALPEGVEGWVEEHPEGSDRGGWVPVLVTESGEKLFFDELETGWGGC